MEDALHYNVVVLGKYDYIIENANRLLSSAGIESKGVLQEDENLMENLQAASFDLILLAGGVDPHLKMELGTWINQNKPDVTVIQHHGGPANLVGEVRAALRI